ncbi:MAG: hypothetical protein AB7J13_16435, partial [Pyrinomonadaceae bacterium]
DITFDVLESAPSGDTPIEIVDGVVSDAAAGELKSSFTPGRISIAGPNPFDTKGERLTPRQPKAEEFDIISEATRATPFLILRRRELPTRNERP